MEYKLFKWNIIELSFSLQGSPGEMGEAGPSGEPGIPVCI